MKRLFIFLVAPLGLILSCKPGSTPTPTPVVAGEAVACFSVNKTVFDSGEAIKFTNCSTNASKYLWSFGDGTSSQSTDANPTWTYGSGGRPKTGYVVTMAAFNSAGKEKDSILHIYEGRRTFDSVRLNSVTGFTSNLSLLFQFGPIEFALKYTPGGGSTTVASLPHTYPLAGLNVVVPSEIDSSTNTAMNNGSWRGKVLSSDNSVNRPFGLSDNIFLSRGTPGGNDLHIVDNNVDMDFFYHISKP